MTEVSNPRISSKGPLLTDAREFVAYEIHAKAIDTATRILNHHEAVSKVVRLYADKARHHVDNDERKVDVWILVLPEIIFERCKPGAKRTGLPMEKATLEKSRSGGLICLCWSLSSTLAPKTYSTTRPIFIVKPIRPDRPARVVHVVGLLAWIVRRHLVGPLVDLRIKPAAFY